MIVVKIELHSAIDGTIKTIGQAIIHNISKPGTNPKRGDYEVRVGKKSNVDKPIVYTYKKPARTGKVMNYPRLSYNVWRLVSRSLLAAFPEENKRGVK